MTITDATFAREITPEYETVGKRRRLVGYTMRLDGELVGFARTHHEAEVTLDQLVFELLSSGATATATQLDGGDHSAENCPRIHPIDVTALLEEADVLLSQTASHPGPNCYCPACMRAAERLIVDAYITRLQVDAGLICQYCGDDHADTTCPQRRSLLAPRVCGNCQGQHSIQACPEIRAALFAA